MNDPLLGQQLGSYRLLQALGQGSFAQVYLGQHIHLGTYVAVKVLHAQLGIREEQEFRKEALLLMQFKNPHIIRILDYGITNNRPFILMELAKKGSLNKIYPRGSRLSIVEVVAYVTQIAEGLDYAHKHNVVHRDIKPENILVGDNDELMLADFGIAKLVSTSRSNKTSNLAGTITYMAPEQIMGKPVQASDQYALGIMAYEWLTGRLPYQGTTNEVMGQHLQSSPPLLRQYNPEISSDIEWAVLAALKKEPDQRFGDVRAFANALRQAARIETTQLKNVKPKPQVVRQSDQENAQVGSNSGLRYIQSNAPLTFTTLPGLPQAHLTEFWWPTFIVATDERRAMNQGGLPHEQLDTLGALTGFPSQLVPLPTSSSVWPPSTGSLKNIRRISGEIHSQRGNTQQTGAACRQQAGVKRTTDVTQQATATTGSPQKTTPGLSTANLLGIAITALCIGSVLTLAAASSPNHIAIDFSWVSVGVSMFAGIGALGQAQKHTKLQAWVIFILILAIVMLIVNIPVQININHLIP
jgi:serine/threonine protein kinase